MKLSGLHILYIGLRVWEYCDSQMQYMQARFLNHKPLFFSKSYEGKYDTNLMKPMTSLN